MTPTAICLVKVPTLADHLGKVDAPMAFLDESLARETYENAVKRFAKHHPELTKTTHDAGDTLCTRFRDENGMECGNFTATLTKAPLMREIYPQVSTDYAEEAMDDDGDLIVTQYVDAWPTTDEDDEDGRSVATIELEIGCVCYNPETDGANCVHVFNAIEDFIAENEIAVP